MFDAKQIREVNHQNFKKFLLADHENLYYLYDPAETQCGPITMVGKTVVFCSPDKRNYRSVKHFIRMFYMLVWSYTEALACKSLCYPTIELDTFISRFHLVGGSARHLFTKSNAFGHQLDDLLCNASAIEIAYASMDPSFHSTDDQNQYQWLKHITTNETYTLKIVSWMQHRIMQKLPELYSSHRKRFEYLRNRSIIEIGHLYQGYVQQYLASGKSLTAFSLKDNEQLHIPCPKHTKLFSNQCQITCNEDCLYIPVEPNKAAVDLVMPPYMFQITVNKRHSINDTGLQQITTQFISL